MQCDLLFWKMVHDRGLKSVNFFCSWLLLKEGLKSQVLCCIQRRVKMVWNFISNYSYSEADLNCVVIGHQTQMGRNTPKEEFLQQLKKSLAIFIEYIKTPKWTPNVPKPTDHNILEMWRHCTFWNIHKNCTCMLEGYQTSGILTRV